MQKQTAFYKKLKEQLDRSTTFPSAYLFKFIVPTDKDQLQQVREVFATSGAEIRTKNSKTDKYISISITMNVKNSEEIIQKYKDVSEVEGILSL